MKKWLLAAVAALCVSTCVVGFAACGKDNGTPPEEEHHFSAAWSSDENNHWHACTDEGCTQKSNVAPHLYGDDDECDVCHYTRPPVHAHTWEAKFDETSHWQETTCSDHAPEKKDVTAHSFGSSGACTCGVKQIETEVYAVYKSYTLSKEEEPLSYTAWLDELKEEDVESVSLNLAGDGVLHYADDTEEVAYYAPRTVKVNATDTTSEVAVLAFWAKVTVTVNGGEPKTLAIARPQEEPYAELTFTPVGYSSDTVVYNITFASADEIPQGDIIPYPYDTAYKLVSDSAFALTVEDAEPSDEFAATFEFAAALSLTSTYRLTGLHYTTGSGYKTVQTDGITPGAYKLSLIRDENSGFDKWKEKRPDDPSAQARVNVIACQPKDDLAQGPKYSYLQQLNQDSEDSDVLYTYIYWSNETLAKTGGALIFFTTFELSANYSFTLKLERVNAVKPELGETMKLGIMPYSSSPIQAPTERMFGLDVSSLDAGEYVVQIDKCAGFNPDVFIPSYVTYAIDDGEWTDMSSQSNRHAGFVIDIPEDAKTVYFTATQQAPFPMASVCDATMWKVTSLTGQTNVELVGGRAYFRYSGEESKYFYGLSADGSLAGVSLKASRVYSTNSFDNPYTVLADGADNTHVTGYLTNKNLYFIEAENAPAGLKFAFIENTEQTDLEKDAEEATSFTFSETDLIKSYQITNTKNSTCVLTITSDSDLSGISVYKDGALVVSPSKGERYIVVCTAHVTQSKAPAFTIVHKGSSYPAVEVKFSALPTDTTPAITADTSVDVTFAENEHIKTFFLNVTQYGFSRYIDHFLTIGGDGANMVSAYVWKNRQEPVRSFASSERAAACNSGMVNISDAAAGQYYITFVYEGKTGAHLSAELMTFGKSSKTKDIDENVETKFEFGPDKAQVAYCVLDADADGLHYLSIAAENGTIPAGFTIYSYTMGSDLFWKIGEYISGDTLKGKSTYLVKTDVTKAHANPLNLAIWYTGSETVTLNLTFIGPNGAETVSADVEKTGLSFSSTKPAVYYSFTPEVSKRYYVEVSGADVKDFSLYNGTEELIKTTSSSRTYFSKTLTFTTADPVTFAIVYTGKEPVENIKFGVYSSAAGTTATANTQFDFALGGGKHAAFVTLAAQDTKKTYSLVFTGTGGSLYGIDVWYATGTTLVESTLLELRGVQYGLVQVDVPASSTLELLFTYSGQDTLSMNGYLADGTVPASVSLTSGTAAEATLGSALASRVAYFTYAPAQDVNVTFTLNGAAGNDLKVYLVTDGASAPWALGEGTSTTELKELSSGKTYTICVLWGGADETLKVSGLIKKSLSAPVIQHIGQTKRTTTCSTGQGILFWQHVDGATKYELYQLTSATDTAGTLKQTYNVPEGTEVGTQFTYDTGVTTTGNFYYKLIATGTSDGETVQAESAVYTLSGVACYTLTVTVNLPENYSDSFFKITLQRFCFGAVTNNGSVINRVVTFEKGTRTVTVNLYIPTSTSDSSTNDQFYAIVTPAEGYTATDLSNAKSKFSSSSKTASVTIDVTSAS